jgi:hypothetical protein
MIPFVHPIDAALDGDQSPWLLRLHQFDAIEVHPCHAIGYADGTVAIEQCEPEQAHFWSVYGHCLWGGVDCFEDFQTERAAEDFAALLRRWYPHLRDDR